MNEELNRKLKSVSFNLRRMRNERNQLRAFIHTTTPPSSSSSPMKPLSNNLQEEMLEVQHAQEIEFNNNTRESSSGHGSSSNDQIKFKNGQKSGSGSRLNNQGNSGTINDKHSLQKVRLSVKDLKEVIHISQPPPKKQQPSEPSQQQEQEKMNTSSLLPSHHQKSFIKNNSFPSKDNVIPPHVGSAPSPPIRVAPPRPPSYSSF